MASTWNECRDLAIEALRERWNDYRDEFADEGAVIHEIADGSVPVYNADRMTVAADPEVWGREPDSSVHAEGADLMQIVAVYIYDALCEALWAEYETLREQDEDEQ